MQGLISVGFASDIVLCVATDGHVALEMPHAAGPCFTDYRRHHPESTRLDLVDIEDHGCRDVSLSQPAVCRDEEMAGANALAPPCVSLLAHAPRAPVLSGNRLAREPGIPATGRLAPLRTIVLLI